MAETSVDEAEKCSLNRRKNDTASAKEQSMKALDSDRRRREDGTDVDLQKIRDEETQGVCSVSLRPTSNPVGTKKPVQGAREGEKKGQANLVGNEVEEG
ncbi:Uncharacterized protein HZ326_14086, partial [Fusarium oxysporum f. sp. albedinis]